MNFSIVNALLKRKAPIQTIVQMMTKAYDNEKLYDSEKIINIIFNKKSIYAHSEDFSKMILDRNEMGFLEDNPVWFEIYKVCDFVGQIIILRKKMKYHEQNMFKKYINSNSTHNLTKVGIMYHILYNWQLNYFHILIDSGIDQNLVFDNEVINSKLNSVLNARVCGNKMSLLSLAAKQNIYFAV